MLQNDDCLGTEPMDYGAWSALLRSLCGRHNLVDVDQNSFCGWLRSLSVCGFTAVDIRCNAHRFERTHRDVRLDDLDHYKAVFQVAGHSTIYQNDQCATRRGRCRARRCGPARNVGLRRRAHATAVASSAPPVEAGISLRYLQKLFTQRGSTCTDFVYSVRLNHAARLLDRREDDGQGLLHLRAVGRRA
jgi:hypothetical protein